MKRRIALAVTMAAVIPALMTGCRKEQGPTESDFRDGDGFTVSIITTKTCLTSDNKVAWSDGDEIIVAGASEKTMTVLPFGTGATTATLSGTAPDEAASGRKYTGFYPATAGVWATATKMVTLPAEREYNASNPLVGVPMYAESDTRYLEFSPLFGLFEFTLTGNKTVNAIKLVAEGADLSGTFCMDSLGRAVFKENGIDSTVVKFNGGILPGKGIKAYVAVPAGEYTKLTIIVRTDATDTWGGIYSKVLAPTGKLKVNCGEVYATNMNTTDWDGIQLWAGGCFWANRYLGAENPMDLGDYFSWGGCVVPYYQRVGNSLTFYASAPENIPGKYPTWLPESGFSLCIPYFDNALGDFTKYLNDGDELEPGDDAAVALWGGNWRMPSKEDVESMMDNSNTTRTFNTAALPYEMTVQGKGDFSCCSIVFPSTSWVASGSGLEVPSITSMVVRCWTRTCAGSGSVYVICHESGGSVLAGGRNTGRIIRPVQYL